MSSTMPEGFTLLDVANNEKPLYEAKVRIFKKWWGQVQQEEWRPRVALKEAETFMRRIAGFVEKSRDWKEWIKDEGLPTADDVEEAAIEMLSQFKVEVVELRSFRFQKELS